MMQVGARIGARRRVGARLVERARVVAVARVVEVDRAEARERRAVAAVTGRQHAVEHIDAALDRLEQIVRHADAHEIARPIGR